jgi:DNA polymerase III delta prime subunit
MNTYLISGPNFEKRREKINQVLKDFNLPGLARKNHPDVLKIKPKNSIGISQVRKIKQYLTLKPYQSLNKAVIVFSADKLTHQAQNAMLKTLEEPPAKSILILSTKTRHMLLPTLISRCQEIKVRQKKININSRYFQKLWGFLNSLNKRGVGERLKLIEPYSKNRQEAISFCQDMILILRHQARKNLSADNTEILKQMILFQQAKNRLEANIHVGLTMDNLAGSL